MQRRMLRPPFAPMEALSVDEIPTGKGWQYEPKWDGFRCLVFRNGGKVDLRSKAGRSLTRYFPELVEAILEVKADKFAIDGEIVVPHDGAFSFDDLLQRIHPAASRVKRLAAETPALLIAFDLLADIDGRSLTHLPLRERRQRPRRRAAEQRDEIEALHSITSSARASSEGGTSRPSALAALRLTTSSNLTGAWTGSSLGFEPLRMRSAYDAARRYSSTI